MGKYEVAWVKHYTKTGKIEIDAQDLDQAYELAEQKIKTLDGQLKYNEKKDQVFIRRKHDD